MKHLPKDALLHGSGDINELQVPQLLTQQSPVLASPSPPLLLSAHPDVVRTGRSLAQPNSDVHAGAFDGSSWREKLPAAQPVSTTVMISNWPGRIASMRFD